MWLQMEGRLKSKILYNNLYILLVVCSNIWRKINMNNEFKKSLVIISVILIILSGTCSAYTINTINNAEISQGTQQKTMTIYRVGPDGTITTVEVNIPEKSEDVEKYLESKCSELFERDIEMQNLVTKVKSLKIKENSFFDEVGLFHVKSSGKGFHINTKLGLNFFNSQFMIIRVILATFLISPRKGIVAGIYNDENANTTYWPVGNNNLKTYIAGSHTIIVGGFFGYTSWIGRFSCLLPELTQRHILKRSFNGVCTLISYNQ